MTEAPAMTVAVVIGAQRSRAHRCLEALAAQTVAGRLEVLAVDTRPESGDLAQLNGGLVSVLPAQGLSYGEARAAAVLRARADIVAFLEDHTRPRPDWAQAVIDAYQEPCAAVGYAITNANPASRVSRMVHLATYGEWESPREGPATSLPGGNISYRREVLLALHDELPTMLEVDFNLHTRLNESGALMTVTPRARIEHQTEESMPDALRSLFVYSRMLGSMRATAGGWSARTRLMVGLKDLVGAPPARAFRLLRDLPADLRRSMRVRRYLLGVVLLYAVGAVGELVGYLAGEGNGRPRLLYWEVDAARTRG
jgi:hypothetical protein